MDLELQQMHDQSIKISVIIPTYNRPDNLKRLLVSLSFQNYPLDEVQVIVVDDGSNVQYTGLAQEMNALGAIFLHQENQGEAIARNNGVAASIGELLIFLDDDMEVTPGYINAMVDEYNKNPSAVLIGNMQTAIPDGAGVYARITSPYLNPQSFGPVLFTAILGGVMGIAKKVYLSIGGMLPVPDKKRGGWIDMDFGYRAHLAGYTFTRIEKALVVHHDYVSQDLRIACQRVEKIAYFAPGLFKKHPGLTNMIPMFRDMKPVALKYDPTWLVFRKLLRRVSALNIFLKTLEWITGWFERNYPAPSILIPLYRWIKGAYIWLGYRRGIDEIRLNNQSISSAV